MKKFANYEQNSALVPIEGADPHKVKIARIWNFLEPLIAYGLVLTVIWTSRLEKSNYYWMIPAFTGLLLWLLILSPLIHYAYENDIFLRPEQRNIWFYFFEARGLGSARKYFFSVNGEPPLYKKHKKVIISMIAAIDVLGLLAIINFQTEYYSFIKNLGIEPTLTYAILIFIGLLVIIDILFFLGFSIMVRFDTLRKGSRHLLIVLLIGIPLIFLFNLIFTLYPHLPYLSSGKTAAEKLADFSILAYAGQFFGYIFWGYLQQLLFLAIFSTNFSRAFNIKKPSGQLLAAAFSTLFFGLMHLPVLWLSFFTWFAGFFWSIYFMRSKNLWVLGICHGALATLLNQLTPVPFSVGPKVVG